MIGRILLYAILALLGIQILRSLFRPRLKEGSRPKPSSSPGPTEEVLVKDPQCGVYLPRTAGLRRKVRGQELYFCSQECYEAFRSGQKP